jgi:hypothetical protein
MTVFNRNPYDCDDLNDLREWIVLLREMVINLQGMDKCNRRIQEVLYQANNEQADQTVLLKQLVECLQARTEQYEAAFSTNSINYVRRLN